MITAKNYANKHVYTKQIKKIRKTKFKIKYISLNAYFYDACVRICAYAYDTH